MRLFMALVAVGLAVAVSWLPIRTAYACLCDPVDFATDGDVAFAGAVLDIGERVNEQGRVPVTFSVEQPRGDVANPTTVLIPLGSSCGMVMHEGEGWSVAAYWSRGQSPFLEATKCTSTRAVSLDRPVSADDPLPVVPLIGVGAITLLAAAVVAARVVRRY